MTKGRKKRVKKVHPKNLLPLEMWVNLIFAPYLNLDQLIAARRSCKTFYSHPRVEALFQQRIAERFGSFQKANWNATTTYKKRLPPLPVGVFAIITEFGSHGAEVSLYSTKKRLVEEAELLFVKGTLFQYLTNFVETNDITNNNCCHFKWKRRKIYGMNDVIYKWIEEIVSKKLAIAYSNNAMVELSELPEGGNLHTILYHGLFARERAIIDLDELVQNTFRAVYHVSINEKGETVLTFKFEEHE